MGDELRRLKELYLPPADGFVLVDVPEMQFVMIEGGKSHVEPPLEVLWWADDMSDFIAGDRAKWKWRR